MKIVLLPAYHLNISLHQLPRCLSPGCPNIAKIEIDGSGRCILHAQQLALDFMVQHPDRFHTDPPALAAVVPIVGEKLGAPAPDAGIKIPPIGESPPDTTGSTAA